MIRIINPDKHKKGCINCGKVEKYSGSTNPKIRYICAVCVFGLVRRCTPYFKVIEASLKQLRPTQRRFKRATLHKKGTTLANVKFKKQRRR